MNMGAGLSSKQREMEKYHWHRYTALESFDRIKKGEDPWVAHGDFLDDWRRSNHEDRLELVNEP